MFTARPVDRPARRGNLAWFAFASALMLVTPPLGAGLPGNVDARLLFVHNAERSRLGLAPLRWDAGLARDARAWARHMARIGYLEHSASNPRDPNPQGENLWAGTRGYYAPEDMVGYWVAEKRNFRSGVIPSNSTTGDFENVGHYTQVVWRSTRTVGCAVERGNDYDFLVCRYQEGGNVIGEEPY